MSEQAKTCHAWYSQKQANLVGTLERYTADELPVVHTMVTEARQHECKFDDVEYLGEVLLHPCVRLTESTHLKWEEQG